MQEPTRNAGEAGLILGLGRSPGERNGNPLQYSCLGNPMDRGYWWATVHGVARVGHDLVTKPPPPSHTVKCCKAGERIIGELQNEKFSKLT